MDGLDSLLENGSWFIRNNSLILKKWHPNENLMKEDISTVLVWVKLYGVPVTAFSEDGLSAISTKLDTPLMLDSYTSDMCMQSWGRSSYTRAMIELRANVCASCKVFRHIHEECLKNTGVGEKKTLEKPSQTSRGVLVGQKIGSDNDVELGTNERDYKQKINEIVLQTTLFRGRSLVSSAVYYELAPHVYPDYYDSKDKAASVDIDMARSMASERVGFGSQSLLEQWRDSYSNGDYDEDPYDDDMYEGQDLSQELQAICDNLDILCSFLLGRKKK
ncbi:retrotransposon protein, putative, ty1-copia subclass [Tanacetum coccineum]